LGITFFPSLDARGQSASLRYCTRHPDHSRPTSQATIRRHLTRTTAEGLAIVLGAAKRYSLHKVHHLCELPRFCDVRLQRNSSRRRNLRSHCASAMATGSHTTTPVRKDDCGPCTVMEGSRGRGLGPTQAILVEVSALGAGGLRCERPTRAPTLPLWRGKLGRCY
jgi:hypothetical protein